MPPKKSKIQSPSPPATRSGLGTIGVTGASGGLSEDCEQILRYVMLTFEKKFDEFKNELLSEMKKKDDKIGDLEQRVSCLSREVTALTDRLDTSENYNRQDEFIVTGGAVPAAAGHSDNPKADLCHILKFNLKYELPLDKLISVRYIGVGSNTRNPEKKKLLVKVVDGHLKQDIIRSCKSTRPPNLFINDNLTPSRSKILFALRQVKRKKLGNLSACGSLKGDVYAWIRDPSGKDRKFYLNTWSKLENFCEKSLNIRLDDLMLESTKE